MRIQTLAIVVSAALVGCDGTIGVEETEADRDTQLFDGQVPYTDCVSHNVSCNWSTQHCRRTLRISGWDYYCAQGTNVSGTVYEGCARNPSSCGSNGMACVRTQSGNTIDGTCQYLGCKSMPSLCSQEDMWGRKASCVTTQTIQQPAGFPALERGECRYPQLTVYLGCMSSTNSSISASKIKSPAPHKNCDYGYRCTASQSGSPQNIQVVSGNCQKVVVTAGQTWCNDNGGLFHECDGTMICKDKCGTDANGSYSYGVCVAQSELLPAEGCDAPTPKSCAVACTAGCNTTTGQCACQAACGESCNADGSCASSTPAPSPAPAPAPNGSCPPSGASPANPPSQGDRDGETCGYSCWGKGTIYNICGTDKWQFCLPSGHFAPCQDIP